MTTQRSENGRWAAKMPGRPRTERITTKIDAVTLERIKAFVVADGCTLSEWMGLAIVRAAEERYQAEQEKSSPDSGDGNVES